MIEGYKLYKPQIKKAIVSCDVIFDKQVACDQSFNEKRPSSVQIHFEEQSKDQSMQPTTLPIMTLC